MKKTSGRKKTNLLSFLTDKRLYHASPEYDLDELDPRYQQGCYGGQKEGIYFFTKPADVMGFANSYSNYGDLYPVYVAKVPRSQIKYPDWRLDLFFANKILDDLPKYLKSHYFNKLDKDGFVPLNIPSQWGESMTSFDRYDRSYYRIGTTIKGLEFKDNECLIHFLDDKEVRKVILSSDMRSLIGLADSLIEHLCENDKDFLRHYNRQLKKETDTLTPSLRLKAIKYVGKEKIPVKEDELFCLYESYGKIVTDIRTLALLGGILAKKGKDKVSALFHSATKKQGR